MASGASGTVDQRRALLAAADLLRYLKRSRPSGRLEQLLGMIGHLAQPREGNRLVFCIPLSGEFMYTRFFTQWLDLGIPAHDVYTTQGVYISEAHNGLTGRTLSERNDFDAVVWLEHDHYFDRRMLQRMRAYPKDALVVGAPYYTREVDDPQPMYGTFEDREHWKLRYLKPSEHLALKKDPNLHPVDFVPMGCTFIRREVFERVPQPWWQTLDGANESAVGDDVFFSRLVGDHGIQVYVDTALNTGHFALQVIDDAWYEQRLRYRVLEDRFGHLLPEMGVTLRRPAGIAT